MQPECVEQGRIHMTRIISWGVGILAVTLVVVVTSQRVSAQAGTAPKLTFLTFSGPVQVPGTTLPAGTYMFRLANPAAQTIWTVLDANGRHVLAQFFVVPTRERTVQEVNRAGGKPVVRFHEAPQGVAPAMKILYYPTDAPGNYLLYPRSQAEQIAAVTHQPVLATDSDPARSRLAHVITIKPDATTEPDGAEASK
jgi:hypothetical protein